jgi:hypothetical protein
VLAFGDGLREDGSLDGYEPANPDSFGFTAQVFIGKRATTAATTSTSSCARPPGSPSK